MNKIKITEILLDRDTFNQEVLKRDNSKCVICGKPAQDVHHIVERKLFTNGGYFASNGVSLCNDCHIKTEQTIISCEELRNKAGITDVILPEHLNWDEQYDKWGNVILTNGMRLKGEMFFTEQVQKVFKEANLLGQFLNYVKYPRTMHFSWSPNLQNDDRLIESLDGFQGEDIVITIKMDGENANMYSDRIHARSIETDFHESRTVVRALHGSIKFDIPEGWRICGENMFAEHSIHYNHLSSYFLVFSIWNNKNICLSWDDTKEWCELLGLKTVPVIYEGKWDEEYVKNLDLKELDGDPVEGYVVRIRNQFPYSSYKNVVAKCVRKGHVITDQHWMKKELIKNQLEKSL